MMPSILKGYGKRGQHMKREIEFVLNGEKVQWEVEPQWTLLHFLREIYGLTGTKEGCGYGECGACTVIIDGQAVNSCLYPILEAEGKKITTIEGLLSTEGMLDPLQKAFVEEGAVQCGFCTPGMIMSAKALLDENKNPTEDEVKESIEGNLCRCTGYVKILDAIKSAAGRR
jgi:aerobic-type carbon monoxide dehydrogenase small subunit (CoxS/CutS family)